MNKVYEGKSGIKVKCLLHSVSAICPHTHLVTFEVEYPRIIHAELLTHGMLVRNSASSRAIPVAKMKNQLNGVPVRFGENQSGMQDRGEDYNALIKVGSERYLTAPEVWDEAKDMAVYYSDLLASAGYHKQVSNRLTEPFQVMRVLISATEWSNFFWLRDDDSADPTIQELAKLMKKAYLGSYQITLYPGEWHLPYFEYACSSEDGILRYIDPVSGLEFSLEDALKVSTARCAAVSFRNEDYDLEKSKQVFQRLVGSEKKHASAFGHQATPMKEVKSYLWDSPVWEEGVSHVDRDSNFWSGQFKGWIQHRKLIEGENYTGPIE